MRGKLLELPADVIARSQAKGVPSRLAPILCGRAQCSGPDRGRFARTEKQESGDGQANFHRARIPLPPMYPFAMKIKREPTTLQKKAKRGHHGYPVATVAYYGPDASRASKVAVGIIPAEDEPVGAMERWFSETQDLRLDRSVDEAILAFVRVHDARTVTISPGIIGCPHEEGIDYPEGEVCPRCPYWATRDRWTGEELPEQ